MGDLGISLDEILLGVSFLLTLILFILVIGTRKKLTRLRKRYDGMMDGTGVPDLEGLLIAMQNQLGELEDEQRKHQQAIQLIRSSMEKMKAKTGVYRYNAFNEQGNDMSFSIAIVDDHKNGFVLTGIHTREDHYMYAKPLEAGHSKYVLTPEEQEAISLASKSD